MDAVTKDLSVTGRREEGCEGGEAGGGYDGDGG